MTIRGSVDYFNHYAPLTEDGQPRTCADPDCPDSLCRQTIEWKDAVDARALRPHIRRLLPSAAEEMP